MKALLLLISSLVYAASGQSVKCPGAYHAIGNGCYTFPNTSNAISWFDANIICQFSGGYLVKIETEEEQLGLDAYHYDHFNETIHHRWIGATDNLSDGTWRWVPSGATLDYSIWIPGEPIHSSVYNCAAWITYSFSWNTYQCCVAYSGFYPLCEADPL